MKMKRRGESESENGGSENNGRQPLCNAYQYVAKSNIKTAAKSVSVCSNSGEKMLEENAAKRHGGVSVRKYENERKKKIAIVTAKWHQRA